MSDNSPLKPLAIALGAVFAGTLAGSASATENPFAQTELADGYQVAQAPMTEGKCGGMKSGMEGKCGMKTLDTDGDGKITQAEFSQHHEAMFKQADTNGDGVLDADEHGKMMGGMMGGSGMGGMGNAPGGKGAMEGKCGAGMMGK